MRWLRLGGISRERLPGADAAGGCAGRGPGRGGCRPGVLAEVRAAPARTVCILRRRGTGQTAQLPRGSETTIPGRVRQEHCLRLRRVSCGGVAAAVRARWPDRHASGPLGGARNGGCANASTRLRLVRRTCRARTIALAPVPMPLRRARVRPDGVHRGGGVCFRQVGGFHEAAAVDTGPDRDPARAALPERSPWAAGCR